MNWLQLFIPFSIALEHFTPDRHLLVFPASALAILPLVGWLGRATEQLAVNLVMGLAFLFAPGLVPR
jgi:Ca2+:H+ antiporter